MPPVDAPLRVRDPAGLSQNRVGERRRVPPHPAASPHRDPESPGPGAPVPPATAPHLPALAPIRDNFRWHGDVFVAVYEVPPRKVDPACYADPCCLDDAFGRRGPGAAP